MVLVESRLRWRDVNSSGWWFENRADQETRLVMFLLKLFIKFMFVCDCLLTMSNYDFDQMYHTRR